MFESKSQELLPLRKFLRRLAWSLVFAGAILLFALGLGVLGYHFIAKLHWIDALLNASMILTSMGPVDLLTSDAAKLFASFYALFSGLIFVTVMAVTLAPVLHRILHKFHIDETDFDDEAN